MSERQTNERLRLWLERAGAGFRLRDAATGELVRSEDPRINVIKVAGVSYRLDALQDDAFAPGRRLALVAEPDNEHDPNSSGTRCTATSRATCRRSSRSTAATPSLSRVSTRVGMSRPARRSSLATRSSTQDTR